MSSPRHRVGECIVIAALAVLCLAGVYSRASASHSKRQRPPESQAKNNLVVEASNPKLARLTLEVRAPDLKEPLKYEIKASKGSAVGGIYVPPGNLREVVASAFDERGTETHRGTEKLYIQAQASVPRSIRLEPREADEPLIVTLSAYRVQLEQQKTRRGTLRLRVRVLDPDERPVNLSPEDVKWGVTDPRAFQLIPGPDRLDLWPRPPQPNGFPLKICKPSLQVSACYHQISCSRPFRPCADPWVSITAGGNHTCGITQSGVAYCWGFNLQGELGASTVELCAGTPCSMKPVPVQCPLGAPCRFSQLAAGENATCGIDTNRDAWCWGWGNVAHQRVQAVLAGSTVKFQGITAGFAHVCAISERNDIWCWGDNAVGQLGVPRTIPSVGIASPMRAFVPLHFKKVVAGVEHTCAVDVDGTAMACWGGNSLRQLGPNPGQLNPGCNCTSNPVWQPVGAGTTIDIDAAGPQTTCAHLNSGETACWGGYINGLPFTIMGCPLQCQLHAWRWGLTTCALSSVRTHFVMGVEIGGSSAVDRP